MKESSLMSPSPLCVSDEIHTSSTASTRLRASPLVGVSDGCIFQFGKGRFSVMNPRSIPSSDEFGKNMPIFGTVSEYNMKYKNL
jgi:hypothetical protein